MPADHCGSIVYMLNDLVTSSWFALTGWGFTILGFLAAVYIYHRQKAESLPTYATSIVTAIERKKTAHMAGFEIRYDNRAVEGDIAIATLAIWNRGNRTIEPSDLVDGRQMTIEPGASARILEAYIARSVGGDCDFSIARNPKGGIDVFFACIMPRCGVFVTLVLEAHGRPIALALRGPFKHTSIVRYSDLLYSYTDRVFDFVFNLVTRGRPLGRAREVLTGVLVTIIMLALLPLLAITFAIDQVRWALLTRANGPFYPISSPTTGPSSSTASAP